MVTVKFIETVVPVMVYNNIYSDSRDGNSVRENNDSIDLNSNSGSIV